MDVLGQNRYKNWALRSPGLNTAAKTKRFRARELLNIFGCTKSTFCWIFFEEFLKEKNELFSEKKSERKKRKFYFSNFSTNIEKFSMRFFLKSISWSRRFHFWHFQIDLVILATYSRFLLKKRSKNLEKPIIVWFNETGLHMVGGAPPSSPMGSDVISLTELCCRP